MEPNQVQLPPGLEELETAFLASLSHEFRTPLNVVLGYLDLLEEEPDSAQARHLRNLIRRHAGSLLAMLDNALCLADLRLDRVTVHPEAFALGALLEAVAREAETLWGRPGVTLNIELERDVGNIGADRRAVRQVVKNLLTNALCFTEEGGVVLRAGVVGGSLVEITVADSGPRIPSVDRVDLFEEYNALRADEPGRLNRGLGIVLSVARQLAGRIGGSLEIDPSVQRGSLFRFRFPAQLELAAAAGARTNGKSASPASASPPSVRRKTATKTPAAALRCPPFPGILGVITRALQDPSADYRVVSQAVRADEALSLCVFNSANSAAAGRRRPASTLDEALLSVGINGLRSIVLMRFVHSLFRRWGRVEQFLWEHSLSSAIAASLLERRGSHTSEELYLCGLLHNIGKMVLNSDDPGRYGEVLVAVSQDGEEFAHAERTIFGVAHHAVGAEQVKEAAIPDVVKSAIRYHHAPEAAADGAGNVCEAILVADAIAYRSSGAWAAICADRPAPAWIERRLEGARGLVAPEALPELLSKVSGELGRVRSLLSL